MREVKEMTLQQLSNNHRHWDTRTRAADLLLLGRKVRPKLVTQQHGVSDQSVYNWADAWRDGGMRCAGWDEIIRGTCKKNGAGVSEHLKALAL